MRQHIKELRDGSRINVTREQYEADNLGPDRQQLVYYVRTDVAIIYHMNGTKHKCPTIAKPRFGGRRNNNERWMGN